MCLQLPMFLGSAISSSTSCNFQRTDRFMPRYFFVIVQMEGDKSVYATEPRPLSAWLDVLSHPKIAESIAREEPRGMPKLQTD